VHYLENDKDLVECSHAITKANVQNSNFYEYEKLEGISKDGKTKICFKKVNEFPGIAFSFLSVSALADSNILVEFQKDVALISLSKYN
jgi:hypothetical protein